VTILRKFPIVFVVLALALATIFGLLERNRERQAENQSWVAHTEQVLAELSSVHAALMESELAARGYIFSGDKGYAPIQQQAAAMMMKQLDIVGGLTADNPSQVMRVRRLQETVQTNMAASRGLIEIYEKQGQAAAARAFRETDPRRHLEASRSGRCPTRSARCWRAGGSGSMRVNGRSGLPRRPALCWSLGC
jgi:CHASE3 domain sensor protein